MQNQSLTGSALEGENDDSLMSDLSSPFLVQQESTISTVLIVIGCFRLMIIAVIASNPRTHYCMLLTLMNECMHDCLHIYLFT